MPQDEHGSMHFGQLHQCLSHQFTPFLFDQRFVRRRFRRDERIHRGDGLPAHAVQRSFLPTLSSPQFVVAQVQRDPPEPGRELPARLVILALRKHTGEGFLRQVFAAMQVAGHPHTQPLNRGFPAADQLGERRLVVLRLDAPHRLLIGDGKERTNRGKGSGPHTTIPVRARKKCG